MHPIQQTPQRDGSTVENHPQPLQSISNPKFDLLRPLRQWLDSWEIKNPTLARRISRLIPAQCPFERDICLLGWQIAHIPPLCKLNPLYNELMSLRFRCLCFLADECGEDIRSYI
ncbi:Mo-dependent nitrogenase C-terminal domain-containing protein [Desertifilum sp. FACHB-1129]|uniref:Nitrogenase n=2 Tax=Desertifilum tharense IPPAS B-1220 TaxID=1781255 RepID=A0A1E5QLD3_9CYAN|nr:MULTISPECIES: Mo-dependent nitrogenase C-terminal domain-containing protein [Desertifilum]MCD8489294.1 Mo-dependent nitrogenase C-terminal domain-containing protein [Desertifilum sp.]MBD2314092.1 Mo-dependent nitrogenase C-terminal domain-containing protein [Desertifilum sp. FACHB-1129]MBD2323577.1 Mo-dependent nitrogenase C-terminal domain-containing protein [Desertifilum sp. FACHB-866]MBD2335029.1 Mo-dependent nitrogenase C-terminal domain-containing protein [Desertifilum sp. FACHB-868]OE